MTYMYTHAHVAISEDRQSWLCVRACMHACVCVCVCVCVCGWVCGLREIIKKS